VTHSLRGQLLAWVLLPLALAVAIDAAITWREADRTATEIQDRLLLGSARMIAEQLGYEDNVFLHPIPPAALELFQSGQADHVFYRVTTESGQLLTGAADLPMPEPRAAEAAPTYFDADMRGNRVHVVAVRQPVIGAFGGASVIVEVAQTPRGHDALRQGLWRRSIGEQLLILLLTAVMVLFGLRQGLRPVLRLRDAVLARSAGALEPLPGDGVPAELAPLLDALNDYVDRLTAYTNAQKVFIENAAHQLRTPLTLLSTQVSFAKRTENPQAREESLDAIRQSLQRTIRVVNQLLTLSSAQSQAGGRQGFEPVSLVGVVQRTLEGMASQAEAKDIDLGLESDGTILNVDAHPLMLQEIVLNLLDNAIRYTQRGGVVTARVASSGQIVELSIEDNGPGIDVANRERAFERFVRLDERASSGSGLGLAIVRELALRHGASVDMGPGQNGRGLKVTVAFQGRAPD
jgi:two-component system sensor histidine kinase TctE